MWEFLTSLLSNGIVSSFFTSCGENASWDLIKNALEKKTKDSFEMQVYEVIRDTFEEFYFKYNMEFNEKIVMTSFIDAVNNIKDFDSDYITKQMISETLGLEINNKNLEDWINIFKTICSNPKYQWIHNKLSLPLTELYKKTKDMSWMDKYMKDNACKIECNVLDELPTIFSGIRTNLSKPCWYDTQILICEIVYNAQEHGKASKCILNINKNSITIIDNGKKFNPLSMENQVWQCGGSMAIKNFIDKYSQEVSLHSKYCKKLNRFTIDFNMEVFDVNEMSEIVLPNRLALIGIYKLRYPKGKFNYYYIDIDSIPKNEDEILFIPFSGIHGLINRLKEEIIPQTKDDTIYIYFSDINRFDYEGIYSYMSKILEKDYFKRGIKIELITKN